jgi:hypothetical protein
MDDLTLPQLLEVLEENCKLPKRARRGRGGGRSATSSSLAARRRQRLPELAPGESRADGRVREQQMQRYNRKRNELLQLRVALLGLSPSPERALRGGGGVGWAAQQQQQQDVVVVTAAEEAEARERARQSVEGLAGAADSLRASLHTKEREVCVRLVSRAASC